MTTAYKLGNQARFAVSGSCDRMEADLSRLKDLVREILSNQIDHQAAISSLQNATSDEFDTIAFLRMDEAVTSARKMQLAANKVLDGFLGHHSDLWKAVGVLDVALSDTIKIETTLRSLGEKARDATDPRLRTHSLSDPKVREAVWAMTGGRCWHCEHALHRTDAEHTDATRLFHIDHLVAKDNGGPDHISNYVPACQPCNIAKGARPYVEFTRKRQAQLSVIEGGMKDGTNS